MKNKLLIEEATYKEYLLVEQDMNCQVILDSSIFIRTIRDLIRITYQLEKKGISEFQISVILKRLYIERVKPKPHIQLFRYSIKTKTTQKKGQQVVGLFSYYND